MNKLLQDSMMLFPAKYIKEKNVYKSVLEHTKEVLECAEYLYQNGFITKTIFDKLKKCCLYHDIGKCNIAFDNRIRNHKKFNKDIEVPHNILSTYMLDKNDFENIEEYYQIAFIILYHHAYVKDIRKLLTSHQIDKQIESVLSNYGIDFLDRKSLESILSSKIRNDYETILLKGLFHKCDYSASAQLPIEYENNFLLQSLEDFYSRKNYKKNSLQEFCFDNQDNDCCVVAQTGMGKTEAALLWGGNNKIIYFLPLLVAINSIYDRIKNDLFLNKDFENKVGILHSQAFEKIINEETDDENYNALQHYNATKNYSLPCTVTTIDQFLDFIYKYPLYEVKVANLSLSKVIIDEIQCYDAKLLAALCVGLETIKALNGKIFIATATLPPYIKDIIFKITNFKYKTFVNNEIVRHNLKTIDEEINSTFIANHYNEFGGKNLVICNTIEKCIEIANDLKNLGTDNIKILHSAFTKQDRKEKEKEIVNCGKFENKENIIWITTQIVEASLDIDFNYLFTEMSDLNGLFQRLGRCNRKGKKNAFEKYNCYVYLKTNQKILDIVIDKEIYSLSCKAIKEIDGIILESKKNELIEKYLTTENLLKSKFLKDFREEYKNLKSISTYRYDREESKLRDIKSYEFIPKNVFVKNKEFIEQQIKIIEKYSYTTKEHTIAKNNIKQFLISIPYNKYIKLKKNNFIKKTNIEIILSKFDKLEVYDCDYSKDFGLSCK